MTPDTERELDEALAARGIDTGRVASDEVVEAVVKQIARIHACGVDVELEPGGAWVTVRPGDTPVPVGPGDVLRIRRPKVLGFGGSGRAAKEEPDASH